MKKIVSILLLVAMVFALASCAVVPVTTDTNTNTNTNSDTSTGTSKDTDTDTGYTPPSILDYDRINYEPKYTKDQKKIYYAGSFSMKAPEIAPYYNDYQAAISMTFDDGADLEAAKRAADIISKYGFEGTLMLIAGSSSVRNNIDGWKALVAEGVMDVGGHGWSHKDPQGLTSDEIEQEIKDTMDYLKEQFPDENPLTFATPYAHITDAYMQYLQDYGVIANRLSGGTTINSNFTNPTDIYNLAAPRIDTGTPVIGAEAGASSAVENGNWFIELYHNVRESSESTDISPTAFEAHCQWLYNNYNGQVWFGSYDDVAKYIMQRKSTTIEYTACDRESMTFFAKSDVDYGAEMTVKLYMPFFIDSAYAIIDGEEQFCEIKKVTNARMVMFNIPISQEGVEIKLVMGGNDKYQNNCNHGYQENEVVAPTEATFGYTEMICPTCGHTYKKQYTNKIED